jgi:ADP-ribosylglycohydrolase
MLGAIIGDVIGSVFEGSGLKIKQFPLLTAKNTYTDDTVLTVAVASAILDQGDYSECIRKFARRQRPHCVFRRQFVCDEGLTNHRGLETSNG